MTLDDDAIADVGREWELDRPVVLPTDTVYGLVAPARSELAVAKIFALKDRPIDRLMPVLVADIAQAGEWIHVTDVIHRLAARFWPGALTIVGARRPAAPPWVGDASTLAVRCADDSDLRALAREAGPLAASSANVHGEPTATDAHAAAARLPGVSMVVDGGRRRGRPSTVVVVTATGVEVVRAGPIGAAEIAAVVGSGP